MIYVFMIYAVIIKFFVGLDQQWKLIVTLAYLFLITHVNLTNIK